MYAVEIKQRYPLWNGIIDGDQRHGAICETKVELTFPCKWGSFMWRIIVVHTKSSIGEYTQLARVHNEHLRNAYTYEWTVFNLRRGLHSDNEKIYEQKRKKSRSDRGTKVNHKLVLETFDGGDHTANTSVTQTGSVAFRLSWDAIHAIGDFFNTICADVIVKSTGIWTHIISQLKMTYWIIRTVAVSNRLVLSVHYVLLRISCPL